MYFFFCFFPNISSLHIWVRDEHQRTTNPWYPKLFVTLMSCSVLTNWIRLPSHYFIVWKTPSESALLFYIMLKGQFTVFTFSTLLFNGRKKVFIFWRCLSLLWYTKIVTKAMISAMVIFVLERIGVLSECFQNVLDNMQTLFLFHYPTFPKIDNTFYFNKSTHSGLCFLF